MLMYLAMIIRPLLTLLLKMESVEILVSNASGGATRGAAGKSAAKIATKFFFNSSKDRVCKLLQLL